MKITLKKVKSSEISRDHSCLILVSTTDIERYKKISLNSIISADIKKDRKYSTHKFLFRMIDFALENGINELDCKIMGTDILLTSQTIRSIIAENGHDDIRAWLTILETLFLPMIEKTNLKTGLKEKVVGSISYQSIDEIEMKIFQDKVALFFSDNLNMHLSQFRIEANK